MASELTLAECRDEFLGLLWYHVDLWARAEDRSDREKLEGLTHSFLVILDGMSAGIPGFQLIPSPHPDDKAYCQEEDMDWWPSRGDIREDVMLHDEFYAHRLREVLGSKR